MTPPTPARFPTPSRATLAVAAMAAVYTAVFVTLCVVKHRYYLYDDFDLAIFTQATDQLLRGSYFVSIRGMNWLGDHSSLILFAIAPIYALFRDPQTLLVIQTLALAAGAFPVFGIARRELKNDQAAIGFAALYLLYPALGFLNLFEFHPESIATPALLFTLHFALARRLVPALIAATLALACREDVALVMVPIGLWMGWNARRDRAGAEKSGPPAWAWPAALGALSALALALTFMVLKPRFNTGEASYFDMYAQWGASASEAIAAMARKPLSAFAQLFSTPGDATDSGLKLQFHLFLLAPLAFLPLASPMTFAIALPMLAEHLLSNRTQQHQIVFQYTALLIPVYLFAAIRGLANVVRWVDRKPRRRATARVAGRRAKEKEGAAAPAAPTPAAVAPAMLGVLVALAATTVCNVAFGPLLGGDRIAATAAPERFWPNESDRAQRPHRDRMVASIPDEGAVIAGFEFLSRLSRRPDAHSMHHLIRGTYTYSDRTYPVPDSVGAVVADFASPHLLDYVGTGKTERIQALIVQNRLAPADAAGDLVLFLRDAPRPISLLSVGSLQTSDRPVTFDGQLEFVGSAVMDSVVAAGSLLEIHTFWRRTKPIDRFYLTAFVLLDNRSRQVHRHLRHLGYTCFPVESWPEGATVQETYRLALPRNLPPGRHHLGIGVVWVKGQGTGISTGDNLAVRQQGNLVGLATIDITRP